MPLGYSTQKACEIDPVRGYVDEGCSGTPFPGPGGRIVEVVGLPILSSLFPRSPPSPYPGPSPAPHFPPISIILLFTYHYYYYYHYIESYTI